MKFVVEYFYDGLWRQHTITCSEKHAKEVANTLYENNYKHVRYRVQK